MSISTVFAFFGFSLVLRLRVDNVVYVLSYKAQVALSRSSFWYNLVQLTSLGGDHFMRLPYNRIVIEKFRPCLVAC